MSVLNKISEELDIIKHWITVFYQLSEPVRKQLDRVKHWSYIHPCYCDGIVDILNISKENIRSRKEKAQSAYKDIQRNHYQWKKQDIW